MTSEKTLTEKSRQCHNQKPQPTPDTKRKRKSTKLTLAKKQTNAREAQRLAPSSPSKVMTMLNGQDKEQGNTKHEAPRSINHKTAQNKKTPGPPP